MFDQRKILPSAHMRRQDYFLLGKIHRTPEADAAAVDARLAPPLRDDRIDLRDHPRAAPFTIGCTRFAFRHAVTVKESDREFRSADVDCQSIHEIARISSGEAVPVPFFMIVIEATKFPNRAASMPEPV